jgi:hypothetical protein
MCLSPTPAPGGLGPSSTPADAGGPSAGVPADAVTPCCWCTKHEKNVSEHGSIYVLSTQHPNHAVKFKLTVDLTANEVILSRVLKWGTIAAGVTEAQKTAIKTGLTTNAAAAWTGKYSLKITDAACTPPTKSLPIKFVITWDDAGTSGDLTVDLKPGPSVSSADGTVMNLDTLDVNNGGYTLAHEFGHSVGQVDEYLYSGVAAATAAYKRANGTTETITLPTSGNIMVTSGSFTFLPRFFYSIEIEAQKLLRSGAGLGRAAITCEIV